MPDQVNSLRVLIIHGFAGNIGEIEPLNQFLISRGFITSCPRLKGHDGTRKSLVGVGYAEWVQSAEDGLLELIADSGRVVVVGFSTGGLIAVNLALKYRLAGIVFLNTPIFHWDLKRILLNIGNDFKTGEFASLKYYTRSTLGIPFSALFNFKIFLHKTKRLLHQVTCPILIAQGMKDDTVHRRSAAYIYNNVASVIKELKNYQNSDHIICHGADREQLFGDIEKFIKQSSLALLKN